MNPKLPPASLKGVDSASWGAALNKKAPMVNVRKPGTENTSTRSMLQCSPFFPMLPDLRDPRVKPRVLGLATATTVAPNGETGVVQELVAWPNR